MRSSAGPTGSGSPARGAGSWSTNSAAPSKSAPTPAAPPTPWAGKGTQMRSLSEANSPGRRDISENRKIIYLACPYTDGDPRLREQRFEAATDAAAFLIRQGYIVYSPIT